MMNGMTRTLLSAALAATILTGAMPIDRAGATAAATAAPSRVGSASLVREAAVVCGGNGCNVVQTKAQKRRQFKPLGYTKPI